MNWKQKSRLFFSSGENCHYSRKMEKSPEFFGTFGGGKISRIFRNRASELMELGAEKLKIFDEKKVILGLKLYNSRRKSRKSGAKNEQNRETCGRNCWNSEQKRKQKKDGWWEMLDENWWNEALCVCVRVRVCVCVMRGRVRGCG